MNELDEIFNDLEKWLNAHDKIYLKFKSKYGFINSEELFQFTQKLQSNVEMVLPMIKEKEKFKQRYQDIFDQAKRNRDKANVLKAEQELRE